MYINLALYAGMSLRGIGMPGPHSLGKDLSSSKQHTNSGREKRKDQRNLNASRNDQPTIFCIK